jgi:hypothetical protein
MAGSALILSCPVFRLALISLSLSLSLLLDRRRRCSIDGSQDIDELSNNDHNIQLLELKRKKERGREGKKGDLRVATKYNRRCHFSKE